MLDRKNAIEFMDKFHDGDKYVVPSGKNSILQIALSRYLDDLVNNRVEPELHGCDPVSAREYAIYDTHVLLGLTSEPLMASVSQNSRIGHNWNVDKPDSFEIPKDLLYRVVSSDDQDQELPDKFTVQ